MNAVLDIIKNSPEGCTPINLKNINALRKHILENSDINAQDRQGKTILIRCCRDYCNSNNMEVIKILLMNNADVNIQDNIGSTALLSCCVNRDIEIAELLIENNANVNIQDNDGNSALLWTSFHSNYNDIEIAKLLLKNDADVHIRDNSGDTAIMITSRYVNDEFYSLKMSRLLLEYDAKPHDTQNINIFTSNIVKLNALS